MLRLLTSAIFAIVAFVTIPLLLDDLPFSAEKATSPQSGDSTAAAPAPARYSGRKVHLQADASGHFSADFRFNGRNIPAVIDTGATVVALSRTTARRIGINVTESAFTSHAETANGRIRAAPVTIERLALGRIELRNVDAAILQDGALPTSLIGMSFLARLKRYSVEGSKLTLEQ